MVILAAIHPVRDYEAWKRVFDEGRGRRRQHGVLRHWIYRSVDDEGEVMVLLELESRATAEAMMMSSDDLRLWMDRAGVDIYPAVLIGEQVESYDYGGG